MERNRTYDVPALNAGKVVRLLTDTYSEVIQKRLPMETIPSVMFWGPPGIGKSMIVREIAQGIEQQTGKKTTVTDVRLLLFNPIDLRGIPTANKDKTLAVWLKPKIFQMDPGEDVINILFLDEISAAPQSVQKSALQITLDRTVGEHELPTNCIVIAAGNRVNDKSMAYMMPKALLNRLLHIEVRESFDAWKSWAVENGISGKVLGFLSFKQDRLMTFDPGNDDRAFATPRSWEMVSNLLNSLSGSLDDLRPLIAGLIGEGLTDEFLCWEKTYRHLPSIEDIFDGKDCHVPNRPDALYALTSSMVSYAREHRHELDRIANSVRYAGNLPPDFAVLVLKDYLYLEKDYREKLIAIPEFRKWVNTKGVLLNGSV